MENSLQLLIGDYVHKLNGNIGLIRTRISIIEMEREELLKKDELLARSLEGVKRVAEDIGALTDEFKLSFLSPESAESISIKAALTQAVQDVTAPASVAISLEVPENLPSVHATSRLVEVFRNLTMNAFEAMPDGGTLNISVALNQANKWIEITFADTGRGLPPYVAESLFEPYFSTKKQKGHGLGLWWSKLYLKSIGGNLELLSSKVGSGAEFLVTLPLRE